ncbi:MAG: hypothetical protein ACI9NC_006314, partial [Verrucomicrobiales bacterium]
GRLLGDCWATAGRPGLGALSVPYKDSRANGDAMLIDWRRLATEPLLGALDGRGSRGVPVSGSILSRITICDYYTQVVAPSYLIRSAIRSHFSQKMMRASKSVPEPSAALLLLTADLALRMKRNRG